MMKEYHVNSISNIDKVIIVAKYKDKWILSHDNINLYRCITGNVVDKDVTGAAINVINSIGLTQFNISPLWDYETEEGSYRVFFADVEFLSQDSDLVLLDTIPQDSVVKDLIFKAEVMTTSNRLLSFIDSLSDVKSCVVHGKKTLGSVSEVSSFELILGVNNARTFAFKLPDLLSEHFYTSLQAYRVFPDKFVLNIIFSKINPLFVVRFSILK